MKNSCNLALWKVTLFSFFFVIVAACSAQQYVTITDSNFVKYLHVNFKSCMNGNQLDVSCQKVKDASSLTLANYNLYDLNGVQYFINLKNLNCSNNKLKTLPSLQSTKLELLICNENVLTSLPPLPITLCSLECNKNKLTSLPSLPASMSCGLKCINNELTALPELPVNLKYLACNGNKIHCFPTFPRDIRAIYLDGNPFTCLPNHTPYMDSNLLAFPVCKDNDPVKNPHACSHAKGISGFVFKDDDKNCNKNINEFLLNNLSLKLYSQSNTWIGQVFSGNSSAYYFSEPVGTYRVELDTVDLPVNIVCKRDSVVVLSDTFAYAEEVNFAAICKAGIDLGVQAVTPVSAAVSGQVHELDIIAGNLDQWYNLACSVTDSGEVSIRINGPVTYQGVPPGALIPTVSGNELRYKIANFGTVKVKDAFRIYLRVNDSAHAGNEICIEASVKSFQTDRNPLNNSKRFCYYCLNSLSPIAKTVSPYDEVGEGYNDWFSYTLHIRNPFMVPVTNLVIADTLDVNLEPSSFQLLNYSHPVQAILKGNVLSFRFSSIQLADSISNDPASRGFIHYRVKPLPNLPVGTTILNSAFFYADVHTPIKTNTTVNHYTKITSTQEEKKEDQVDMIIYPNPAEGVYFIELPDKAAKAGAEVEVRNLLGTVIYRGKITTKITKVDVSDQPRGVYIISVSLSGQFVNRRVIKQ